MAKVNEQTVLETMQIALKLGDRKIMLDGSVENIEEWDSLGHLSILTALDELFHGQVAGIKKLASADSVKKILGILKKNSLI